MKSLICHKILTADQGVSISDVTDEEECENSSNVPMDFKLLVLSMALCSETLNNNSVSKSGRKERTVSG